MKAAEFVLTRICPLLAGGYVVGSGEESERFLEDFRRARRLVREGDEG